MALNFRLNYNNGFDYIDLFPRTQLKAIKGSKNLLQFDWMVVTIPAFTGFQQKIPITLSESQKKSFFYVELRSTGETEKIAYDTIDQIEIKEDQLIVTRLGEGATSSIAVNLLFMENDADGK